MKDTIMFHRYRERIYADARDTYYWLKLRNKKFAEEFGKKIVSLEKDFEEMEREREETKNTFTWQMEYKEPKKPEKKVWWKFWKSSPTNNSKEV